MKWSIRIGRVQGVAIHVHALFLITLLWAGWLGWTNGRTPGSVAFGLVSICALFACVLIHEIAHTQTALAAGIPVRRIMLLPVGGLAELRTLPDSPQLELTIAAAGPLANLGLALMFGGLTLAVAGPDFAGSLSDWATIAVSPTPIGLLLYLTGANLALFLFNLLPVYPLDGGRMLRGALSLLVPPLQASRITASVGRALAFGLGSIALIGFPAFGLPVNVSLAAVALFLFVTSRVEASAFDQRMQLRGMTVEALLAAAQVPASSVTPAAQIEIVLATGVFDRQPVVPVVVGRRLVGLLNRAAARSALQRPGLERVGHAMRTDFPRLTPDDTLWEAQRLLTHSRARALPVTTHGRFQGLVSRGALHAAARRDPLSAAAAAWTGATPLDLGYVPRACEVSGLL